MKKVLLTFIALWMGLPGFGQCTLPVGIEGSMAACEENEDIAVGLVRIKIIPEAYPLPVGKFLCGEARTGNAKLDAVLVLIGTTHISNVFGAGGRFADRRRRYGLHLWYEIGISESVPASQAVVALSQLSIIEYAGPVYRSSLSEDN